jgi:hypothetical protein
VCPCSLQLFVKAFKDFNSSYVHLAAINFIGLLKTDYGQLTRWANVTALNLSANQGPNAKTGAWAITLHHPKIGMDENVLPANAGF